MDSEGETRKVWSSCPNGGDESFIRVSSGTVSALAVPRDKGASAHSFPTDARKRQKALVMAGHFAKKRPQSVEKIDDCGEDFGPFALLADSFDLDSEEMIACMVDWHFGFNGVHFEPESHIDLMASHHLNAVLFESTDAFARWNSGRRLSGESSPTYDDVAELCG